MMKVKWTILLFAAMLLLVSCGKMPEETPHASPENVIPPKPAASAE